MAVKPTRWFAVTLALVLLIAFLPVVGKASTFSLKSPGGAVVLTFDSGYATHLDAASILEAEGYRGTFYVISDFLHVGPYYTAFLSAEDVTNLSSAGHDIESGTKIHADLTTLDAGSLANELAASRWALEALTGNPVLHVAYPYGASNDNVTAATAKYYNSGRSLVSDPMDFALATNPYYVPAIPIMQTTTLATAQSYIDYASANAITVILEFSSITSTPGAYDWTPENLTALVAYANSTGANVKTIAEALSTSGVGAQGPQGPAGAQGPQGIPGVNGTDGAQGPQGIPGVNGTNGEQGPQGIPGVNGTDGAQGPQGIPGVNGTDGAQGIPGVNGTDGAQGPQGIPGVNGTDGAQGPQGIPGVNGTDGAQGPQGIPGVNGTDGAQGVPGINGTNGEQGIPGVNGTDGAQGPQGIPGANGTNGAPGAPGLSNVSTVLSTSNQTGNNPAAGTQLGANATCPASTRVIGGGVMLTTTNGQIERVAVTAAWPSTNTTYAATGTVLTTLTGNNRMNVQAWAICASTV